MASITPMLASNADNFKAHDPYGWMMAIISMMVVFSALLILFLCFKYGYDGMNQVLYAIFVAPYKKMKEKKQLANATKQKAKKESAAEMVIKDNNGNKIEDAELAAVIGMALFLHEDGMHDAESDVLTLTPSASAWTGAGKNQKAMPKRRF